MISVVKETREEKKERYMKMDHEKIVDMLLACHDTLDSISPIVSDGENIISIGGKSVKEYLKRKK